MTPDDRDWLLYARREGRAGLIRGFMFGLLIGAVLMAFLR